MSFRWRYLDAEACQAPGPDVTFNNQTDAEEWLGVQWQGLLEGGVVAVTLMAGDSVVYGPMSLQP